MALRSLRGSRQKRPSSQRHPSASLRAGWDTEKITRHREDKRKNKNNLEIFSVSLYLRGEKSSD
jgi:hypothetical protein